jgi:TRAP-type C4-dicarboxylate transport system permease large subunit
MMAAVLGWMQTVARGILPFVSADILRITILFLVPALAAWLPSAMAR